MSEIKRQWQRSIYIGDMFNNIIDTRKMRLFLLACCNEIQQSNTNLCAMKVAEDFIDGKATVDSLRAEHRRLQDYCWGFYENTGMYDNAAELVCCLCSWRLDYDNILRTCRDIKTIYPSKCAMIIRDIVNPFSPRIESNWLTFDVVSIAQTIYNTQNYKDFPILADALQDAECDNVDILHHCRNSLLHWKGNWVIDQLLNKAF